MFADLDDERGQAETLYALGSLAHKQGQFDKAITHYKKAMKMFAKLDVVAQLAQASKLFCRLALLTHD